MSSYYEYLYKKYKIYLFVAFLRTGIRFHCVHFKYLCRYNKLILYDYIIDNIILQRVFEICDLGVTFDSTLWLSND